MSRIAITPIEPLPDGARFEIRAEGLVDLVGIPVESFVSTFRTRDEP